jgi:hypothetical protein
MQSGDTQKYKNIYVHYLAIDVVHGHTVKTVTLRESDKFLSRHPKVITTFILFIKDEMEHSDYLIYWHKFGKVCRQFC